MHFEQATVLMDFAVIGNEGVSVMPCTVLTADGRVERPKLGSGDPMDAFVLELDAVLQAVRSGDPSPFLKADLARDAIVICQKQTESVKTGGRVKL